MQTSIVVNAKVLRIYRKQGDLRKTAVIGFWRGWGLIGEKPQLWLRSLLGTRLRRGMRVVTICNRTQTPFGREQMILSSC